MGSKKLSAGILLYRLCHGAVEVFLVHPGGPFWTKKDEGAWSIPKGEYEAADDPLTAARGELHEETGFEVDGTFHPLTSLKQPSGKVISAWAVESDVDAAAVKSNTFTLEWPPKSGRTREFPEIDRGAWFDLRTAEVKLHPGQRGFLEQLRQLLQDPV